MAKVIKKKKPQFLRTNFNKKRFKAKWRRPRGIHNKIRLGKKGHRPSIGYKNTKSVRYLHYSGLKPILVYNINDLHKVDPKINVAIISSAIGQKKKIMILEKCLQSNIKILNIKNIQEFIDKLKAKLKEKKEKIIKKETKKPVEEPKKEKTEEEKKEKEAELKKDLLKAETQHPKHLQDKMEKAHKGAIPRAKLPIGDQR